MSTDLATTPHATPMAVMNREQVDLIKRTIAKGATDDELQLFMNVCNRTRLDPFSKQIYAIKRWDSKEKREVLQPQISIDGARIVADRSQRYQGQLGPWWCGEDGVWKEIWLDAKPPVAARVGVLRDGFREPLFRTAKYSSYVQTTKDGGPNAFWRRMPDLMLAKCAEMLALRAAFPHDLSGLYIAEEMGEDTEIIEHHVETPAAKQIPASQSRPSADPPSKFVTPTDTPKPPEQAQRITINKEEWVMLQETLRTNKIDAVWFLMHVGVPKGSLVLLKTFDDVQSRPHHWKSLCDKELAAQMPETEQSDADEELIGI